MSVRVVAYIANEFPSPFEHYVADEIGELRRRGVRVIPCSGRAADGAGWKGESEQLREETVCLRPVSAKLAVQAIWVLVCNMGLLSDLWLRLARGREGLRQRLHGVAHTLLGAALAVRLRGRGVEHIHAHHGYFASWVAMVAARLLGAEFSLTLHGSDVLLHGAYLDTKLANCGFCCTVSEYNRQFILDRYPEVEAGKVVVQRLGVDVERFTPLPAAERGQEQRLRLLSVGRLHAVKNHRFLIDACARLEQRGIDFECVIAGDGPEREALLRQVRAQGLNGRVRFLGQVEREKLRGYYATADLVVLTSRSEGVPLVLMEAMAQGRLVLAPAITGIPELVDHGKSGLLYREGSMEDFMARVEEVRRAAPEMLERMRRAGREQVRSRFNLHTNVEGFGEWFVERAGRSEENGQYENPVLQQI